MKNWRGLAVTIVLLFIACPSAFSRPVPAAWQPTPMKLPPAGTNSARWHSVKVTPKPGLPKIHFYDKLNPVWWFGNIDEPVRPHGIGPTPNTGIFCGTSATRSIILIITSSASRTRHSSATANIRKTIPSRERLGFCAGAAQTGRSAVPFLQAWPVQLLLRLARAWRFRNQTEFLQTA